MFSLNLKGRLLTLESPLVMGVLNLTQDSFHAASRVQAPEEAVSRALHMLDEGADILDLGAQSTRPGSTRMDADEELFRLTPVIQGILRERPDAILSVDTYHAAVAKAAVASGALIVNDVSGGSMDRRMLESVASLRVPYVCMHMQGRPENMQESPRYGDVVGELLDYFSGRIRDCRDAGIHDIIIDPGFGFGKTVEHNYALLDSLELFGAFGLPVLAGLSRKSMIQKVLGVQASQALNGTTVLNTIALMKGARILRVHDVQEAVEAVRLVSMLPGRT
jgi:dihydropteroate synthase